jgi:hypothetical protein
VRNNQKLGAKKAVIVKANQTFRLREKFSDVTMELVVVRAKNKKVLAMTIIMISARRYSGRSVLLISESARARHHNQFV